MKEDVLEQIVDDYLQLQGYLTTHNVRFSPSPAQDGYDSRADAVPSDVDVVGYHPTLRGPNRVVVVSCKSWQNGFAADYILAQLRGESPNPRRPRWMQFRELWVPKWADAFNSEIERRTGSTRFTYCLAVTRLIGDGTSWQRDPTISANLRGNPLRFLTLEEMWSAVLKTVSRTPASSEMGRLAQLLRAARLTDARQS